MPTEYQEEKTQDTPTKHHVIKTLLAWESPGRPFKIRQKEYFINTLFILILIEFIVFLVLKDYLLMLAILSISFVGYALAVVPPHNFRYKISTEGITIEDHFYLWQELYDFYFKKRDGTKILHVRTKAFIPGQLVITLGNLHEDQVKSILLTYLPFREVVGKTFVEKSADWLSHNFPLENKPHPSS